MPFRPSFECLWCATPWTVRGADDLEGFAQLCPSCVGRAGQNGFLRFRLKTALAERAQVMAVTRPESALAAALPAAAPAAAAPAAAAPAAAAPAAAAPAAAAEVIRSIAARPAEDDDWYLRRGRHARGPIHDQAWEAELDQLTRWLDGLPIAGEIVELAAGTGWWSPLLASKGNLSIYDGTEAPLEKARQRLVAHGLRAHLHVRDAFAAPDRQVDALFCGFWLSHVPRTRVEEFLSIARRWLRPGGLFACIDARSDPQPGPMDRPDHAGDGGDGGEVLYDLAELEALLERAGFAAVEVASTARFFVTGRATA